MFALISSCFYEVLGRSNLEVLLLMNLMLSGEKVLLSDRLSSTLELPVCILSKMTTGIIPTVS